MIRRTDLWTRLGLELLGLGLWLSWMAGTVLAQDAEDGDWSEDTFDDESWDEDTFDEESTGEGTFDDESWDADTFAEESSSEADDEVVNAAREIDPESVDARPGGLGGRTSVVHQAAERARHCV